MSQQFKTVIILRNDSSANWLTNNSAILMRGEVGLEFLESGKVKMKIGDGIRSWQTLPYFGGETDTIEAAVTALEIEVGKLNTDILALMTRTATVEEKLDNVYTKEEVNSLVSTLYRVKGSVNSYTELPFDPMVGDVYNIIYADFDYGISAGDNVVWTGESWDRLGGTVDLTNYVTKTDFNALTAAAKKIKYEIFTLPKGVVVDYDREKEIRVFCPRDTEWTFQNPGENGDANSYYMQFRAYAPEGAVSFKEDDQNFIEDTTMYTFDNNPFAGIDQYGRKYSVVWLALARFDSATNTWNYYGANSSTAKYIGWYYTVEWYDADGVMISTDTIRINLSNEDCHTSVEPFYMGSINVNKLTQDADHELVLNGGTSFLK